MNMRGAAMDALGDALGSVGVLAAAVVLMTTGWPYADTVASLLIVVLIVPRAVGLIREVWHVLLEGAPANVDVDDVQQVLLGIPGVVEVHDQHVWTINDRTPAASAHLVLSDTIEPRTAAARCSMPRHWSCGSSSDSPTRPCSSNSADTPHTSLPANDEDQPLRRAR
jgi:cobalt-zinc-cadmium efflux system protein